jgi:predicted alpha/beta-hydrolase family hydrolase
MNTLEEFRDDSTSGIAVRGFLHSPPAADGNALVLTHGAGANCSAPLLVALADAFCTAGWLVLRCDLPFRQARPSGPPAPAGQERDRRGLAAAVASLRKLATVRVSLGGHSYGGRMASMLAAEEPAIAENLLLLSYPLHPPQRPDDLRTAHFPRLRVPALFVHGVKDGFGTITELISAMQLIPAPTELIPVERAGHELMSKRNRDELTASIVQALTLNRAFESA